MVEYPQTEKDNDFWKQVRRTMNGKPVSEDQINLIVDTIQHSLCLNSRDSLLDIACGNGALASYFLYNILYYYGIDISEYLINIANKYFSLYKAQFQCIDMISYLEKEDNPLRFTKCLCYGAFSYFSNKEALTMLNHLYNKFSNIQKVFIGNLPDKDKVYNFYSRNIHKEEILNPNSDIGIWRTENEIQELISNTKWNLSIQRMPNSYYASHYRYDILLSR